MSWSNLNDLIITTGSLDGTIKSTLLIMVG
jgi:hypothetical protein